MARNYARDRICFCNEMFIYNSTYCCVIKILFELWQISYSSKDTQLAEHPLYNTIVAFFCRKGLVLNILLDENYFVYRSTYNIQLQEKQWY